LLAACGATGGGAAGVGGVVATLGHADLAAKLATNAPSRRACTRLPAAKPSAKPRASACFSKAGPGEGGGASTTGASGGAGGWAQALSNIKANPIGRRQPRAGLSFLIINAF